MRGKIANTKLRRTVSMESPIEILRRHIGPAHSDATSNEKPVLPKRTQNSDPLPNKASGDKPEDWEPQISAAISWGSERFFSSACCGKNKFGYAQEYQEQVKQLAHSQRAPLQQHPKSAPLALLLFRSEGRHQLYNRSLISLGLR